MLTPLELQSRLIIGAFSIAFVLLLGWATHHHGYTQGVEEVRTAWNEDKAQRMAAAEIQENEARNKEEAQRVITQQKEKEYEKVKSERDAALAKFGKYRLCPVEIVPGDKTMPMARGGETTVPGETKSTAGAAELSALAASFDFSNAVKDRDQCSALIEWVKAQGM